MLKSSSKYIEKTLVPTLAHVYEIALGQWSQQDYKSQHSVEFI